MLARWNHFGFQLQKVLFIAVLIGLLQIDKCRSINEEGLALLQFREGVESDPNSSLANWNSSHSNPCQWAGVHCVDGEVQILDLNGLSLGGMLAPELGKLSNLRSLLLFKNNFSGVIPKEIAELPMLEVLDLRGNQLSGAIPAEMGDMLSLKHLLICHNKFQGSIPIEFGKLNMLIELQYDEDLLSDAAAGVDSVNRKVGQWFKFWRDHSHGQGEKCYDDLAGSTDPYIEQKVQHVLNLVRRKLLQQSSNLAAAPITGSPPEGITITMPSLGSGSFPAISNSTNGKKSSPSIDPVVHPQQLAKAPISNAMATDSQQMSSKGSEKWKYAYVLPAGAFLLTVAAVVIFVQRKQGKTTGPWKTGLSGQLQKAFVAGVPKINRVELETACEDFSNIICTSQSCTLFKGTLSSGVEIAVISTTITSAKDWSKCSEVHFRKKVDALSRLNHKNFVNLLGYCEEDEPFLRMMVFEYASCGSLFNHLHAKEFDHLDWAARMRIIMGIAYCLQYMHHELNPPVTHPHLASNSIFLTDDNAAKIAEFGFWKDFTAKIPYDEDSNCCILPFADTESSVYNFGLLLLEIISGKLPHSKEQGSLVNWAAEYLNDRPAINYVVDPSLESFKDNELEVVCEVILECINQDPGKRPTMKEVIAKLREVLSISPEAATPRLSPLWWAELEILSLEAS